MIDDRADDIAVREGRLIRRYRKAAGYTQQQLATKIGYSKAMIGNVEHGRHRIIARTERQLRIALHIPQHEFDEARENYEEDQSQKSG